MKFFIRARFQRTARRIKYRFAKRALILVYHRVTKLANDPFLLAVEPERFAEQMELVRSCCNPISLQQLVDELQEKKLTKKAVVVTFDDGYADNLLQAKPVLERYEIPATVFVTTGHIGSQHEFWWDELDRLLLQPGSLPAHLKLCINGDEFEWNAGEADEYSVEIFQRFRDWHIEREDDPHPRYGLFHKLYEQIHSLPYRERQRILAEIMAWAGAEPAGRSTHRSMTKEELILLEKGGLVDVGAHTVFHSNLAAISPDEQRQEIQQSKDHLEKIVNHPVTSFAFPYGSCTAETIAVLRETGFESACATHADAVWPKASRFQLPRLGVRNWDRQKFVSWLSWWVDG
jgi:peptidoglycan/xylan/chitin deacetylase (PgdA/CDA1 family)